MKAFLLVLLGMLVQQAGRSQSLLNEIRDLGVDSVTTGVTVYFSTGHSDHAQRIATDFPAFSGAAFDSLGVVPTAVVALLSTSDWATLRSQHSGSLPPPGMPFFSGNVIVLASPAQSSIVYQALGAAIENATPASISRLDQTALDLGLDRDGVLAWIADYVCAHEFGHLVTEEYLGLQPYHKWLIEFTANYIQYAILRSVDPERGELFTALYQATEEGGMEPANASIEDFENRYFTMSGLEYGWYQSWIENQAIEVSDQHGYDFIRDLANYVPWPQSGTPTMTEMLVAVETIAPGITSWALPRDETRDVPRVYSLSQNYPNPFNPTTTISYDIARATDVILAVCDVLGRTVRVLASGTQPAGSYEVSFDAAGLPSGIYVYHLQAGDYVETKRMVIVK